MAEKSAGDETSNMNQENVTTQVQAHLPELQDNEVLPAVVDPHKDIEKEYKDQWYVLEQFKSSVRQDEAVMTEAVTGDEESSHAKDSKAPLAGENSSTGSSLAFSAPNETDTTGMNKDYDANSQVKEYQDEHEQWFELIGTKSNGSSRSGSLRNSPLLPDPGPLMAAETSVLSQNTRGDSGNETSSSVKSNGKNPQTEQLNSTDSIRYKEQWYALQELKASIKDLPWNERSSTSETGKHSDKSGDATLKDETIDEPRQQLCNHSSGSLSSKGDVDKTGDQAINAKQVSVVPPNQRVSPLVKEGSVSDVSIRGGTEPERALNSRSDQSLTSDDTPRSSQSYQSLKEESPLSSLSYQSLPSKDRSLSSKSDLSLNECRPNSLQSDKSSIAENKLIDSPSDQSLTRKDRSPSLRPDQSLTRTDRSLSSQSSEPVVTVEKTLNSSILQSTEGRPLTLQSDQPLNRVDSVSERSDYSNHSKDSYTSHKSTDSSTNSAAEQHAKVQSDVYRTSPSTASEVSVEFVSLPNPSPSPDKLNQNSSQEVISANDNSNHTSLQSCTIQLPVASNAADVFPSENGNSQEAEYGLQSNGDFWVEPSRVSDYIRASTLLPSRPLTIGRNGSSDVAQQPIVSGTDTQNALLTNSVPIQYPSLQAVNLTQGWNFAPVETSIESISSTDVQPSHLSNRSGESLNGVIPSTERLQPDGRDGIELTAAPFTNVSTATVSIATSSTSVSSLLGLAVSQLNTMPNPVPLSGGTSGPLESSNLPKPVAAENKGASMYSMSEHNATYKSTRFSDSRQFLSNQEEYLIDHLPSPKRPLYEETNTRDVLDADVDDHLQSSRRRTTNVRVENATNYLPGRPKTQVSMFQARERRPGMVSEDEESSPVTKLLGPSFKATQEMLHRLKQEKLHSYSDSGTDSSKQDDSDVSAPGSSNRETLTGSLDRIANLKKSEENVLSSFSANTIYAKQNLTESQSEVSLSSESDVPKRGPGFAWSMPIPPSDYHLPTQSRTKSIFSVEKPTSNRVISHVKKDINIEKKRQKERDKILAEIEARYPVGSIPEDITLSVENGTRHQPKLAWQGSSSTETSLLGNEIKRIPSRLDDVQIKQTKSPDIVLVEEGNHYDTKSYHSQEKLSSPLNDDVSSDDTDDLLSYEPVLEGGFNYLKKKQPSFSQLSGKSFDLATKSTPTAVDEVLTTNSRDKGHVPKQEVKPQQSPSKDGHDFINFDVLTGFLPPRGTESRSTSISQPALENIGIDELAFVTSSTQQREDKALRDYHLSLGAGTVTPLTDLGSVNYGSYIRPSSVLRDTSNYEGVVVTDEQSIEEQSICSLSEGFLSNQDDEETVQRNAAHSQNENDLFQSESSASDIYRPLLKGNGSSGKKKGNTSYGIYDIRKSSGPGSTNRRRKAMGLEAISSRRRLQENRDISVYVSGGSAPSSHSSSQTTNLKHGSLLRPQVLAEEIPYKNTTVQKERPKVLEKSRAVEEHISISDDDVKESIGRNSRRYDRLPKTSAENKSRTQKMNDKSLDSYKSRNSKSKTHQQSKLEEHSEVRDRRQKKTTNSKSQALKDSQDLNELWNRFQRSLNTDSPESEGGSSTLSRLSKLSSMLSQPLPKRVSTPFSQLSRSTSDSKSSSYTNEKSERYLNAISLSDTSSSSSTTTTLSLDDAFLHPNVNNSVARQLKLRKLLKNVRPDQILKGQVLKRSNHSTTTETEITTATSTSDLQTVLEDSSDTSTTLEAHAIGNSKPRTIHRETHNGIHSKKDVTKRPCICGAAVGRNGMISDRHQDIEVQTINSGMHDVGVNFPTPRASPRDKARQGNKGKGKPNRQVNDVGTQTREESLLLPSEHQIVQTSNSNDGILYDREENRLKTPTKIKRNHSREERYVITQHSPRDEKKKQQRRMRSSQLTPRKQDSRPVPSQNSPDLVKKIQEKKRSDEKSGPVWFHPVSNSHYSRPTKPLRETKFNQTRVDTFNTTVGAPHSLQKLTLQEAFLYAKPSFVKKSLERLEKVAQKRRDFELKKQQKENLASNNQEILGDNVERVSPRNDIKQFPQHRDVDERSRYAYGEHLHQPRRRQMTRKEMLELNKRLYNKLPEVKEMQEKKRRQAFYCSNLQRARLYGKRVRNRLKQHGT